MSHVQVRNVPDELHRRLKARAALEGVTVSELLIGEIERLVDRPSQQEVLARIATRAPVSLEESSAAVIEAERSRP